MIQVNRIYLIFNRLVTKKFLVDTSEPMLDIKIHIVASEERREAVLEQITRPVFAVMERGPLADICSYISYSSIDEILKEKRLSYMTDDILKEFEEWSQE